ncbi:Vma21p SCDLUD_002318 [Saccharomycodes ludwigii]|uniref:Vma21p n=1 Tax=Saccharomycodes ludwigii TaxID=36035 RepID=UPI001E873702|nr:hypothetical protein SCDLUD_002318 [Saccharomycodes ludwigii]KAH3900863.1 hypothetical protein SCDLUD_002318 [Saccharomycodes ludwigii]
MTQVDIPREVINKLMFFTAAMVIFPLVTFFATQYYTTNTIVSGGLAALAANIVLVSYCVVAFTEKLPSADGEETSEMKDKKEK